MDYKLKVDYNEILYLSFVSKVNSVQPCTDF